MELVEIQLNLYYILNNFHHYKDHLQPFLYLLLIISL